MISAGSRSRFLLTAVKSLCLFSLGTLVACVPSTYPPELDSLMSGQILEVDIAASEPTLLPHGAAQTYILGSERDNGGVFCAGVAESLAFIAQDSFNIPSLVIHYGFWPNGLTHAVTLVHLEKEWWVLDSNLGITYLDPLNEVLLKLERGELPEARFSPVTRDVHFESPAQINHSWLTNNQESEILGSRGLVYKVTYSYESFKGSHDMVPDTLNELEKMGNPRDLGFLMLYPYGLFDGAGYHAVDSWEKIRPILEEMQK